MNALAITDMRALNVRAVSGTQHWRVTAFDGGKRVMLNVESAGVSFHAHFDAEAWSEFQYMVGQLASKQGEAP